jgi:ribosomal protein L37AE/L43A
MLPRHRGPARAEGEVNMAEDIPISTDKKCPACASTDVHEVPANTRVPQVVHLWSCAKCGNAFRLVEAAGDQRDTHFDL